jgi:hypothetical protein
MSLQVLSQLTVGRRPNTYRVRCPVCLEHYARKGWLWDIQRTRMCTSCALRGNGNGAGKPPLR